MSNSINITVKWKFRDGKSLPPTAMKNYLTYTEKQVIDRHFCRDVFSNYVSSFDNQDRITKSLSSIVEERARHSCNTLEEITNDVLNTYDMGTKGLFSKVDAKIQALKEHLLDCKSFI